MPHVMPVYRLSYNALALVLLLVPVTLVYQINGEYWWRWTGVLWWIVRGLPQAEDSGPLRLSPFHRIVRHPWYFFGLVILWTRNMNAPLLVPAVMITLYYWVGSRLEDRKLVYYYGEVYREYRKRVPGLIPLPGCAISAKDANRLMRSSLESEESRT